MPGERRWSAWLWVLAGLALAASLNTWLSAPRHQEILARVETDLQQVQAQAGRWAMEDAWRARMDAGQAWQPADLDELAIRALGAGVARITPRPAVPAAEGWHRREAAIEFREVLFAEAAQFLAAAGAGLPAWRLREIEIQPSAEAGKGTLTCVLETLEKKQP